MPAKIIWTDDMLRTLIDMRTREPATARASIERCAQVIGVCTPTALAKAREMGLADRLRRGGAPGLDAAALRTVRRLHDQGWRDAAIARHLGKHPNTISRYVRMFNGAASRHRGWAWGQGDHDAITGAGL